MTFPSDFENELNALTREYKREQPQDHLQFCANYFLRRLESQRAEHRLLHQNKQPPSLKTGSNSTNMAESKFPGTNPFSSGSSGAGMAPVNEDEEMDHVASPTAPAAPSGGSGFGQTGFHPPTLPPVDGANLPSNYNFGRRTSVSAESMNPAAANDESWTPPVFQKTADQQSRLLTAVSRNFLFSHLEEQQMSQVLGAMQEKNIPAKGIRIITQGEAGDFFYVVDKGGFDIYVNKEDANAPQTSGQLGEKVDHVATNGSFGELALMYNTPRAATILSTEPSSVWALDRITFRRILMDNAFRRRRLYESFLSEVKLLESLTSYERTKIADALHTQKFPAGHTIIKQGDIGESFFILESGEAEVFIQGESAPITKYGKGDYFGELALLDDKPRAASVISKTEVKVATLGKEGFQRLLGPVEAIMRRNDPSKRPPTATASGTEGVDPLSKS